MNQDDIQKALEAISKSNINVAGDLVLEKKVEYKVDTVEAGGIGIQIINGKETTLAKSDKEIKEAIEALLKERDEKGNFLLKNKKQWWAVYRVLATFCQYPKQMTSFMKKIIDMEIDYGGNTNVISYDSLRDGLNSVPQIASNSPLVWETYKEISDNYKQQYEVAEFLMVKLGIKS